MVVLTFLTLIVLRRYAKDTRDIARFTAQQLENSQRPFLVLEFRNAGQGRPADIPDLADIRNRGTGTALNIEYKTPGQAEPANRWPNPLATNAESKISFPQIKRQGWQLEHGLVLEYDSVSGRRYRTTVARDVEFKLRTTFEVRAA
jgi:hypothetical protein